MNMKHKSLLGIFLFCLVWGAFAGPSNLHAAGIIQLPRTGQTTCYNTTTNAVIPCTDAAAFGQDGNILAGAVWPDQRFTNLDGSWPVNSNVVLDKLTGLQWAAFANTPTYSVCTGGSMSWASALDYVACLNVHNYLGYSDWRLPNIIELGSLQNYGESSNVNYLLAQGFVGVGTAYYSSTTYPNPANVWHVDLTVGKRDSLSKTGVGSVWPVRAGQSGGYPVELPRTGQLGCYDTTSNTLVDCGSTFGQDGNLQTGVAWPVPRFSGNDGSGTVKDYLTGLTWLRDANCLTSIGSINKSAGKLTWADALIWTSQLASPVCGLNDGSRSGDWRLPNENELLSILDYAYSSLAISNTEGTGQFQNLGDPFIQVSNAEYYMSSTTSVGFADSLFAVYYGSAQERVRCKNCPIFVWPVRTLHFNINRNMVGSGDIICTPGVWVAEMTDVMCSIAPAAGYHLTGLMAGPAGNPVSVGLTGGYLFSALSQDVDLTAYFAQTNIWLIAGGVPEPGYAPDIVAAMLSAAENADDEIRLATGAFIEPTGVACQPGSPLTAVLSGGWDASTSRNLSSMSTIAGPFTISSQCTLIVDGITII